MKYLSMILTILAFAFTVGCEENVDREAEVAVNEFRTYMENVEDNIEADAVENWNEVEARYEAFENSVGNMYETADEEVRAEIDEVRSEYKEAKMEYEARLDQSANTVEMNAEQSLANFREFVNRTAEDVESGSKQSWEEVEAEYNEAERAIEANMNNMSADMREEYNQLKENWKETKAAWDNDGDM